MDLKAALAFGFQSARSLHYAGQQMSLPLLEALLTGKRSAEPPEKAKLVKEVLGSLKDLLLKDSQNISRGLYPWEVLRPEAPQDHLFRYFKIIRDGIQVSRRRQDKDAHDFAAEAEQYFEDVPEYFRRNFHYQTGGYLTSHSADLYEHQVEILFAGGADAMRRLLLPLMKAEVAGDGEGLHFLEVAAGTGRLSRFVKLAYPKARITVTDLSWPYLRRAQKNLRDQDRLEFLQAAAENLPFKDQTFDAVYSCFLFHELPEPVRKQVLAEGLRVLKPGGLYGFVDSLQKQDATGGFSWALERFPQDFHEPFYKNYTLKPMENMMEEAGFTQLSSDRGFFAKAVLAKKPLAEGR